VADEAVASARKLALEPTVPRVALDAQTQQDAA
jgi:hypothetical protein